MPQDWSRHKPVCKPGYEGKKEFIKCRLVRDDVARAMRELIPTAEGSYGTDFASEASERKAGSALQGDIVPILQKVHPGRAKSFAPGTSVAIQLRDLCRSRD